VEAFLLVKTNKGEIFMKGKIINTTNMDWKPHPNPDCKGAFVKLIIDASTDENLKTLVVKLQPGGEIPLHTHPTLELFYIMEGEGIVTINDTEQKVTPGDAIYAPTGSVHGIRNESSEDVYFIANFAPAK
jgi:quercetin dioxygenase-like cupin family protein